MQLGFTKNAVAIGIASGCDQPDFFIVADGFGGQARLGGSVRDIHAASFSAGLMKRRRKALVSTRTEDAAIAPAPSIGDSRMPQTG